MKVIVAGASGFIGRPLVGALRADGHEVLRLVRRAAAEPGTVAWNPAARQLDPGLLEGVDVAINLAGENIAGGHWTATRRDRLMLSRVDATATLVSALGQLRRRPKVLLSASAIGFYGERGDEELDEASPIGQGFLPEVCLAWETHAERAVGLGLRTVTLRFGMVLAPEGGALAKLLPLFRLGFGGRLGRGAQWMSWITRDDVLGAIRHAIADARCAGPLNVVAPTPVTNAEFTHSLARALHRPALVPVPAWALRMAFGQMADETLLVSTRAMPERLLHTGYAFHHPDVVTAFDALLR